MSLSLRRESALATMSPGNFSHHFYMSLLCAQKHIDESFAIAKDALIIGYGKGKADNFVLLSSCTEILSEGLSETTALATFRG